MSEPHHIPQHITMAPEHAEGNQGRGRFFFLPGSAGRARRLSERFLDLQVLESDRQHHVYLGRLEGGADVGAVATGMGCPSVEIIVTELLELGVRCCLRVGTAGSLQPRTVPPGSLVIATAAVRDESTSDAYADRGVPAVASSEMVRALERAAVTCGLAGRTFRGIVHSKDSLHGREAGRGPRAAENRRYMEQLSALGVLATEMESAHLFMLGLVHGGAPTPLAGTGGSSASTAVHCGALLALLGDHASAQAAEAAAIDLALATPRTYLE